MRRMDMQIKLYTYFKFKKNEQVGKDIFNDHDEFLVSITNL